MGENTHIEWATHTFNPWIGCTQVSPGCKNCYAEVYGNRFGVEWGTGKARRRTSEANWRKPLTWNRKAAKGQADWRAAWPNDGRAHVGPVSAERPRVFCASLADWLDTEVDPRWLADLLALIAETPHLDWLLLTKRPELWRERVDEASAVRDPIGLGDMGWVDAWLDGEPPANVWLGTTVEDQQRADGRIPWLLGIPARVRFLSCEPLLGEVDLGLADGARACELHWVIAGGESGPGARPMDPAWARSLRDQCVEAGVAFHFKQWGEWKVVENEAEDDEAQLLPTQLMGTTLAYKAGKKKAGRLLDGRTWDEVPA